MYRLTVWDNNRVFFVRLCRTCYCFTRFLSLHISVIVYDLRNLSLLIISSYSSFMSVFRLRLAACTNRSHNTVQWSCSRQWHFSIRYVPLIRQVSRWKPRQTWSCLSVCGENSTAWGYICTLVFFLLHSWQYLNFGPEFWAKNPCTWMSPITAASFSEMSVSSCRTTRCHNAEYHDLISLFSLYLTIYLEHLTK